MYFALILVACARATFGEIMDGVCDPNVKPAGNIEEKTLEGLWYAYESFGDATDSCATQVRIGLEGNKLVFHMMFIENGQPHELHDSAHYENGKILHNEQIFTTKEANLEPFTVVDFNGTASAVNYHCKQITPATKNVIAWKFSKDPALPEYVRSRNDAVVQRYPELATGKWRERGTSDCPAPK